jgi:hypothetical protein
MAMSTSPYGAKFDRLAETWQVIENRHDTLHPDRSECGGVGQCSMMAVAVDLQHEMIEELINWRTRG